MNASISLFTMSYCYRAQLAEAFSEGKTMQQLKAMENCPPKNIPHQPQAAGYGLLFISLNLVDLIP